MWARVSELLLGVWLLMSPFIFGHYPGDTAAWVNDLVTGGAIMACASLSFWQPLRRIHFVNAVIALWLIGFGYFYGGYPSDPGFKNHILLGLVLVFFAIAPNNASDPPLSWQRYYADRVALDRLEERERR
jgi:hypothetical protein